MQPSKALRFMAESFIIKNTTSYPDQLVSALIRHTFPEYDKMKLVDQMFDIVYADFKNVPKPLLIKALIEFGMPQNTLAEWFGISEAAISQNKNKAADDPKYETFSNLDCIKRFTNTLPMGIVFEDYKPHW